MDGVRSWLETTHVDDMVHLDKVLEVIDSVAKAISHTDFEQIPNNSSCTQILDLFGEYTELLRLRSGIAAFWVTFLDMVEVLLGLIRLSREGD